MRDVTFHGLAMDAADPPVVATFWGRLLGWEQIHHADGSIVLTPTDDTAYVITVRPATTPKPGPNRIHLDLTSDSPEAMAALVQRALDAGGRLIDIGQTPQDGHEVLADPEGNELCIIEPGNRFLAGTGTIGAINCDGSQALGYFWSKTLGWPLVWDEDEETAIQSPSGGTKITWSGPPLMPRYDRDRIRLVVSTADPAAGSVLIDPDGNEVELLRVASEG